MIVTLYTKPDCALCDDVRRDLVEFGARMNFDLRESNILEDDALFAQFRYLIPVVQIDPYARADAPNAAARTLLYPPHEWLTLHNALTTATKRSGEVSAHGK